VLLCTFERYLNVPAPFREGIGHYANAVELHIGDPASFEPVDRDPGAIRFRARAFRVAGGEPGGAEVRW
jgi:hypothetical protein